MKRMSVNIDKVLSSICPSYKSGGVVNDLDLNKVQLLKLRQVKWIKAILRSEKLPKNVRTKFLQNLKAVVKKAIAKDLSKSKDDSRERTDKQSSDESGDEEGSGEGRGHKSSDEDFEEQQMMTVEQAELLEQYVNDDSWNKQKYQDNPNKRIQNTRNFTWQCYMYLSRLLCSFVCFFFHFKTTVNILFHKLGLFNRHNVDTYFYEKK